MDHDLLVEQFFETLIAGDRQGARSVVAQAQRNGFDPRRLISDLYWPTYSLVEKLHRDDQLTTLSYQLATRLMRVLVDRTAADLACDAPRGRTIFAVCGPTDCDELGAQMAVDLLEATGFEVAFAGGGLPADEILSQVNHKRPDVLLMFASSPSDLPGIRQIIDQLKEIGASPKTQVAVGGGVFNRAEGLAMEIGAPICAETPIEMVEELCAEREVASVAQQARQPIKRTRRAAA